MNTLSNEHLQNEALVSDVCVDRVEIINFHDAYIDAVVIYMAKVQSNLGDTASKHFVPKDYTKTNYEALPTEPKPKLDAYEQALVEVEASSLNKVDAIDEDMARIRVEQSIDDSYIQNGITQIESYVKTLGKTNVG